MSEPLLLDRTYLAQVFSEVDGIRQQLPEHVLNAVVQEVVKRAASNLRAAPIEEFHPTPAQIDALCNALLSQDASAAITLIEQAQRSGSSYDALYQTYLAVAARQLGTWWDQDRVSFYKVTIAAGRIYAILRMLRMQKQLPLPDGRRSAVFVSAPTDNHTLGITVAADMARDRGWDIELLTGLTHDELVHDLEQRETPLIGISASGKRVLPALIRLIVALRISNPRAQILVCGQIAAMELGLDRIAGADAIATDFDQAFACMERMIGPAR